MSAGHVLATAAARAGFGTDVVVSCDDLGRRVDARVAALAALTEPTEEVRGEVEGALREFLRAAGSVSGGEHPAYWSWYRGTVALLRAHAERLFAGSAWVGDIRGPNWTPS